MERFDKIRKNGEPLPPDIVYDKDRDIYCRTASAGVQSPEEEERILRYRMYRQIQSIESNTKSIRSMLLFFVVLTVIGLIFGLLAGLGAIRMF